MQLSSTRLLSLTHKKKQFQLIPHLSDIKTENICPAWLVFRCWLVPVEENLWLQSKNLKETEGLNLQIIQPHCKKVRASCFNNLHVYEEELRNTTDKWACIITQSFNYHNNISLISFLISIC